MTAWLFGTLVSAGSLIIGLARLWRLASDATVIEDGRTGFMHTDPAVLVERMRDLLADPGLARLIGEAGQVVARDRFSIERFGRAWNAVLREAADRAAARPVGRAPFPRRRGTSGAGLSRIPVA